MADISTWSPLDESNTAAPPAGAPENMPCNTVNNTMRAMMGACRRWYDTVKGELDYHANLLANAVPTTGGTLTGGLAVNSPDGITTTGPLSAAGNGVFGGTVTAGRLVSYEDVDAAGSLNATGNLNVNGNSTVAYNGSFGGNLGVAGTATVGELDSTGPINAAGNIVAGGAVTGSSLGSTGDINAAGTVNAAQYNIHGLTLLISSGTSTAMYNSAGQAGLILDTSTGNFYNAVAHNFRNAAGSASFAAFDATGTYNASGSWTVFSDESLKSDIVPYSRGLSAIQALCPVSFKYASGPFAGDETRYGLVAQDMQTVVPEMVGEVNFGGERFLGMQPGMLIWLLVNSCRELAARVEALEGGK